MQNVVRTTYRIRRICLRDHEQSSIWRKGQYVYLGQKERVVHKLDYHFPLNPPLCSMCGRSVWALEFETLREAKKRLRNGSVVYVINRAKAMHNPLWRIEVVEVSLVEPERPYSINGQPHLCTVDEKIVLIRPDPSVLDKLAGV